MDTIKKILQPGKQKDDEILYGQGSSTSHTDSSSGAHDTTTHGSTATTGDRTASGAHDSTSTSQPKEHGVLRQILNPGGDKYDPASFQGSDDVLAKGTQHGEPIPGSLASGSSAQHIQSQDGAHGESGVLRQIINPGGHKYDGQGFEPTGQVGSGTAPATSSNNSALSIKSGVLGPYANTDTNVGSSTHAPTSGNTTTTSGSHLGRDAAIGGAAGAGAGALAHETPGHHHSHGQTTSGQPFSAGNTTSSTTAPQQYGSSSHTYGSNDPTTGHLGNSATAATAGALGATGLAAHEHARHEPSTGSGAYNSSQPTGQSYNTGTTSTGPTSGAYASNQPTGQSYSTGTTTTGPTSGAYASNQPTSQSYGTNTSSTGPSSGAYNSSSLTNPSASTAGTTHHSHHGTEAALGAGALGAGGLAAHEHNKSSTTSGSHDPLSHHVHNGVTEQVPHKTGHHSLGSSRSTQPAHEPTPFHATPAAYTGQSDQPDVSHKVYNTVTGSHSDHEPSHSTHSHHGAATGAGLGAAAGLGGAALADRTRHDPTSTSHGLGSTSGSNTSAPLGGTSSTTTGVPSSIGSSSHPAYETGTSRQVPGAFPGEESSHSGYGTAGAAGGTAAAALAAQQAMHRHETQQGAHSSIPSTQHSTTGSSSHQTSTSGVHHDSALLNKLDPRVKSDNTSTEQSHHGRDAALVGGTGAAVGAGAYGASHHERQSEAQKTSSTTGPHSSDLLNKLDPRVKNETPSESHSHTGRNAAVGTGAAAATAGGLYEADKHHGSHTGDAGYGATTASTSSAPGYGSTSTAPYTSSQPTGYSSGATTAPTSSAPGYGSTSTAPYTSSQPTGYSSSSTTGHQTHDHTGRNAALGAGAGAATGAGVYEAQKHHGHHDSAQPTQSSSTGVHHDSALLNKLDPRVKTDQTQTTGHHDSHTQHSQHHTGRDAAVGTGVGAAGVGAYEADKHHGHGTTTQHSQHHTGRDAAVGTGVGAAGVGAYEANKHHGHGTTAQAGPGTEQTSGQYAGYGAEEGAVPHRSNLMNKLDPRIDEKALAGQQHGQSSHSGHDTQHGHHSHTGRDAAIVGGAGAAAGTGLYEADKHHGTSTATGSTTTGYGQTGSGPATKTVGPHESNVANVVDPRVQPQPQYQKEHTTTGPHQSDTLNKLDPNVQHDPTKGQTSGHSHAATGAAVGAGTGYAAHEHDKKHHGPQVREDEHHHNKLHKDPPAEKKEGFLHKLLHPGKKENEHSSSTSASHGHHDSATTGTTAGTTTGSTGITGQSVDPQTGLPINTQYGTGQGGTDANPNIHGYQQGSGSGVQSTDWTNINKQNTPY